MHQNCGDSVSLNRSFSKETFTMESLISFMSARVSGGGGGGEGGGRERTAFFVEGVYLINFELSGGFRRKSSKCVPSACQRKRLSLLL